MTIQPMAQEIRHSATTYLSLPPKYESKGTRPESSLPSTVLAFGLVMAGTGGLINPAYAANMLNAPTGTRVFVMTARDRTDRHDEAKSPATIVGDIKAAFGLNVTQLARILQVERPTIYQWMDEDQNPRIQPRNRERLLTIQMFAEEWNRISSQPANKLFETLSFEGKTLMDLLGNNTLDKPTIRSAMQAVATQIAENQAKKKARSIAGRLRDMGFPPPPKENARTTLAANTRSVASFEE